LIKKKLIIKGFIPPFNNAHGQIELGLAKIKT
jgi:hypothetical protein